jgi:hypothetical protein
MFAVLDLSDFAVILLIVSVFSAGGQPPGYTVDLPTQTGPTWTGWNGSSTKLDLILTHLGLDYSPPPKAKWQDLVSDPAQKISAIKAYREEHGVGLAEAKRAVEEYMGQA